MKKDLIFTPVLLLVAIALFLLKFTGMPVHIALSAVGAVALVAYTVLTKKQWKLPVLEILMRASYGIALITGIVLKAGVRAEALSMVHKATAVLFVFFVTYLFVQKFVQKLFIKENK